MHNLVYSSCVSVYLIEKCTNSHSALLEVVKFAAAYLMHIRNLTAACCVVMGLWFVQLGDGIACVALCVIVHGPSRLHLVPNKLYKKQPSSDLSVAPIRFGSSIMVLKRLQLTYGDVTLHGGTINLMNRASMGLVWLLCWPCSISASLHLAHSRSPPPYCA